jgi:hypothetical protein
MILQLLKKTLIWSFLILTLSLAVGCSNPVKPPTETPSNTDNTTNVITPKPSTADTQELLLLEIEENAKIGKTINCEFMAGGNVSMQEVESSWGKADESNWVVDAKGNYSTYKERQVVLGSNKGDAIFEVRSFDTRINQISRKTVESYFGIPDHSATTKDEDILGYIINENYKLLLVFKQPTTAGAEAVLDHYSVFYPKGTLNNMADDPGREW